MKTILLLLATCLCALSIQSQVHFRLLDHNNASALLSDAGTFFEDFDNLSAAYEIPKNSGTYAFYAMKLWFGGITQSGDTNYILGGEPGLGRDVFNGPYSSNGNYDDPTYQNDWDSSIWMFTQEEIDIFYQWWLCESGIVTVGCGSIAQPTNETLSKIYSWPGNGNVANGENYWMAPFYDNPLGASGQDGTYNPADGDYPLIKGCKAVYLIQNDDAEFKGYSGTQSMGLELHYMFYQYRTWDYLNDVTFVDVKAFNRGNESFANFAHGMYTEVPLGYPLDNYIGCDSANNMMYFYNADAFDEDWNTNLGYGNTPAALGIVALDGNITSSVPFVNYDTPWNSLTGKQENGQDWLDANGNATSFVYSGNPNNPGEWSELDEGNAPGENENRGVMATEHGIFNPGETIAQSYAIIFSNEGNNLENAQNIIDISSEVKLFYENDSNIPCQGGVWGVNEESSSALSVYPNPTDDLVHISFGKDVGASISVSDIFGKLVQSYPIIMDEQVQLSFLDYPNGVYVIHVTTDETIFTAKVVVQK